MTFLKGNVKQCFSMCLALKRKKQIEKRVKREVTSDLWHTSLNLWAQLFFPFFGKLKVILHCNLLPGSINGCFLKNTQLWAALKS